MTNKKHLLQTSIIADARSFLFVPSHRIDRLSKAFDSGADALILDLEDAVAPEQKAMGRNAIRSTWPHLSHAQRGRIVVRINATPSPWHRDDLMLLDALDGLGAVMLPKAESRQQIEGILTVCPHLPVLPLIETADGLAQIDHLAQTPMVIRLAFGHLDLQADLGMSCGEDQAELTPARFALVLASRKAQLASPIDGVTTVTNDARALAADVQRSRRFGFGAKLCIHPLQIQGTHSGLSPTADECHWAQQILDAKAAADTGGVFTVDGKMVDAPVILRAQQIHQRCCMTELHSPPP